MSRCVGLRSVRVVLLALAVVLAWAQSGAAVNAVRTGNFWSAYSYDAPPHSSAMTLVAVPDGVAVDGPAQGSSILIKRDFSTVRAAFVAAETAPQVLKGAIPDAIPKNLPEQLALNAAKDGQGTQIMANLGDAPRLDAVYGNGDWVKMQYVLRGTDSNVTDHYFRNLTTNMDVEFKFK